MTVYKMIQALAKFDPKQEVTIRRINADGRIHGKALVPTSVNNWIKEGGKYDIVIVAEWDEK